MYTLLEQVRKAKEANLVEDYRHNIYDELLYIKLPHSTTGKTLNHLLNHISTIYNLEVRFIGQFLIKVGSDFHSWNHEDIEWLNKYKS